MNYDDDDFQGVHNYGLLGSMKAATLQRHMLTASAWAPLDGPAEFKSPDIQSDQQARGPRFDDTWLRYYYT